MSAYKVAIDRTTRAIDTRARYFRNLIVAVVALILGSIGWAAVTWRFSPLVGLLLLFPTCGIFFFLDSRLLNRWRSHVLAAWITKELNVRSFGDAIIAIPKLPRDTVQGMLATLPVTHDLVAEQRITSSIRETVAAAVTFIYARESDTLALKMVAAGIVTTSIVATVVRLTWGLLFAGLTFFLPVILGMWLKWNRTQVLRQRVSLSRTNAEFNREKCCQLVADLHVNPNWKSQLDTILKLT